MSEPAFPSNISNEPNTLKRGIHTGMSLRDYFAAKAMQALIANERWYFVDEEKTTARKSYEYSDSMLKERG